MRLAQLGEHRLAPVSPVGREAADGQREGAGGGITGRLPAYRVERTNRDRHGTNDDEQQERDDEQAPYDAPRSSGRRAPRSATDGAGMLAAA